MNLREFIAKVRSPLGGVVIFTIALIVGVLVLLPMFVRDEGVLIETPKVDPEMQKEIHLEKNIPKFAIPKEKDDPVKKDDESIGDMDDEPPPVITDNPPAKPSSVAARRPRIPVREKPAIRPAANLRRPAPAVRPTNPNAGAKMLVIEAPVNANNSGFISERYAPYGRLIACKLVNTLESNLPETPIIGLVTENLYWINAQGKSQLLIPAGTNVYGKAGSLVRNRIMCSGSFTFVWQVGTDTIGYELSLNGIALEKSHEPGNKGLATITDMTAGIPGQVLGNNRMQEAAMYMAAALQGFAQGAQQNNVYATNNNVIVSEDGSMRNALMSGFESLSQIVMQDMAQKISRESTFVRVPAGTEFYIFVTQVIDLEKARIADTQLSRGTQVQNMPGKAAKASSGSASELLKQFNKTHQAHAEGGRL